MGPTPIHKQRGGTNCAMNMKDQTKIEKKKGA
jgi:hypothetical protein